MTSLIAARSLSVGYDDRPVVRDVELNVEPGEVVLLLGPNGAGKTTTLLALAGALKPISGEISWDGRTRPLPLHRRARNGLTLITEERSTFTRLTVKQNLQLAHDCDTNQAAALFPELTSLMSRNAGLLSGGERQMLTLARALSRPTRLLLADELSLGLAPQAVGRLLRAVRHAADNGMGALLVEQHVHRALEIADRVHVLRGGHVVFSGTAADASGRIDEIRGQYIGGSTDAEVANGHVSHDKARLTHRADSPQQ